MTLKHGLAGARGRLRCRLPLLAVLFSLLLAPALGLAGSEAAGADDGTKGYASNAINGYALIDHWPEPDAIVAFRSESVTFPSQSPFSLSDVGDPVRSPATDAVGYLFKPVGPGPHPAVVLLHGAGGILGQRELTYGRQLAAMGVVALVVDAFAARRDRASEFIDRIIKITESMVVADAFAALDYLADRPDVDASRVVVVGFSYGGMASTYAAYEQAARLFEPDGRRFAGHVSFYAPCIGRFDDTRATGAPVLMLMGAKDGITDPKRCAEIVNDLRSGGTEVQSVIYSEAFHQWDGAYDNPRRIGHNLARCNFKVSPTGVIRDASTGLPMSGPIMRKTLLALCSDSKGYMIGRNDAVRARSNARLGSFLSALFQR